MNILIIEDEPGIYNFLKEGLEEEGYDIIIASDGIKGIDQFSRSKPDLVLLDWMLPGMHGIDVCKEIRKQDKETPILFLTAKDTVKETIEGLRAGANDYVKKPFSFEELLERIKIHFRDKHEDEILILGDISLNKSSYQVYNRSEEISLTQREFALLEFLLRNKGKICTRDEIIDKVWNINFEYDTGVIDVFMNSLRKKLNMDKENGYIRTVRGVGYIAND
ncbi:MAG TPA: response regulator transcription factor [Dysgonomonas sp.]|uniref:response regulator transcription factor n=1 Tax=unclassified Dysgonomonas TaxID=2630389 RepID=UPI0025BB25FA|nr:MULTISPECIES: response regulator transcription factor [unclassified Dysgonomonas]HML65169.1 response regulator transcription factor [Dysgonomonas sp.]